MISKVFLNTFWVIGGRSERKEKLFDKAWLRTVHNPYYAGHGYAVSLGHWSLRFGVCTPLYNEVNLDDEGDVLVYSTMMKPIDVDVEEITTWGSSENDPSETSTPSESESQESSEPLTVRVG